MKKNLKTSKKTLYNSSLENLKEKKKYIYTYILKFLSYQLLETKKNVVVLAITVCILKHNRCIII